MNCLQCDGTYIEKSGNYEIIDPYVGKMIIQGVTYYQCDKCKDILYSEAMAQAIESKRNNRLHEILSKYPVSDFISAAETASILGISRQALHKNRRINHGFIYQTTFCGLNVYLKQSVQRYKKTGDGRFHLDFHVYSPYEYLKVNIPPITITSVYNPYQGTRKFATPFIKGTHVSPKEYNYAN